jgi:YbbR domain-containing protein
MKIYLNKITSFLKTDRAILMLCIGIAFLFWLFTKLSYTYRSTLSIRVKYELSIDKVLTSPPPELIEMDVEGSGWDLLFIFFSRKKYKIDVDVTDNSPKTINAAAIKGKLLKQLPENINIIDLRPDLIEFQPEPLAVKEIPLLLDNRVELSAQFMFIDSLEISPRTVKVSGPASVIKNMNSWVTEPLILEQVESNFTKKLKVLSHTNKNVSFNPNQINVSGKVEQVTEKSIELEIFKRSVPDSILLVLLPKKVTITCIVGLSDFDILTADQFTVVADFSKFDIYQQSEVRLELEEYPDYVKHIKLQPKAVEYIIRSRK